MIVWIKVYGISMTACRKVFARVCQIYMVYVALIHSLYMNKSLCCNANIQCWLVGMDNHLISSKKWMYCSKIIISLRIIYIKSTLSLACKQIEPVNGLIYPCRSKRQPCWNLIMCIPVQRQMEKLSTFQQPFLCKRPSSQYLQLAALIRNFVSRWREQQHTLNPLYYRDLFAFAWITREKKSQKDHVMIYECHSYTLGFTYIASQNLDDTSISFVTILYLLEPKSQKIDPSSTAIIVVKKSLTALYWGFRQYDAFCFHRQARHWVKIDCEYCVGKYKSFEFGAGVLSSLINVLFLLNINM